MGRLDVKLSRWAALPQDFLTRFQDVVPACAIGFQTMTPLGGASALRFRANNSIAAIRTATPISTCS